MMYSSLALASPLTDKTCCFSYSKLLFSVISLKEQYLFVYIGITEKYGELK